MEPDTLTLAGVAAVTVSEGVKFLYAQGGELLKRWWDKHDKQKIAKPEPIIIELPQKAFEGELRDPVVHYDKLGEYADDLEDTYARLAPYVNGVKSMGSADAKFVALAEKLRTLLEAVLEQSITFKGEQRQPSGTRVEARMRIDVLSGGEATNVDFKGSGDVRSIVGVKTMVGGKITGVRVRASKP